MCLTYSFSVYEFQPDSCKKKQTMSWWPSRFGHGGDEDHISTWMDAWMKCRRSPVRQKKPSLGKWRCKGQTAPSVCASLRSALVRASSACGRRGSFPPHRDGPCVHLAHIRSPAVVPPGDTPRGFHHAGGSQPLGAP